MPLSTTEDTAKQLEVVTVTAVIKKHKKAIIAVVFVAALLTALYFLTKAKTTI